MSEGERTGCMSQAARVGPGLPVTEVFTGQSLWLAHISALPGMLFLFLAERLLKNSALTWLHHVGKDFALGAFPFLGHSFPICKMELLG